MKNHFFLILMLLAVSSCKNKGKNNSETEVEQMGSTIEVKAVESQIENTEIVKTEPLKSENDTISECSHPEYFNFREYKECCVTDTLHFDLNGNGIVEKYTLIKETVRA